MHRKNKTPITWVVAVGAATLALGLMYRAATLPVAVVGDTGGRTNVTIVQTPPPQPTPQDTAKLLVQAAAIARQANADQARDAVSTYAAGRIPVDATAAARAEEKMRAIAHDAAKVRPTITPTPGPPPCGTPDPGEVCDVMTMATTPTAIPTLPACDVVLLTPDPYHAMPGRYCVWATK